MLKTVRTLIVLFVTAAFPFLKVTMRKGKTTDYIPNRPFDLVGVFHIRPEEEDGDFYQLYVIDDAMIIDK